MAGIDRKLNGVKGHLSPILNMYKKGDSMTKTPSVNYYTRKIRTYGRQELYEELDDSPLTTRDYAFLSDIIEGLTNQQLQQKYHKSASRISQWKRSVFEQMHQYDLHKARRIDNRKSMYDI